MPSALPRLFRSFRWPFSLAVLLSAAATCSTYATIVVDGHDVADSEWYVQSDRIRSQASLTLNCPKQKVTLTLRSSQANHPTVVDVAGCDHSLTYERTANGDDDLWAELQGSAK